MKIGILGTGSVGLGLAKGWVRERHDVKFGSRTPTKSGDRVYGVGKDVTVDNLADAVEFGDVVVFAVPWRHLDDVLKAVPAAKFKGKVVLDCMNAVTASYDLAVGHSTSAAEELAKRLPGARVVKAFNTVFAENMSLGRIGANRLAAFIAGDDAKAKEAITKLAADVGFEPVDAGPLKAARYLEPLALLLISLAYGHGKMGGGIGLTLVRKKA